MINIPICLTVAPHTPSPQRPRGQRMVGFRTTWKEALRHYRSFQIQNLKEMKENLILCLLIKLHVNGIQSLYKSL